MEKQYTAPSGYNLKINYDGYNYIITSQHAPRGEKIAIVSFAHPTYGEVEGLKFSERGIDGRKRRDIKLYCPDALNDIRAHKAEEAAHRHTFFVLGWEGHEVTLDDRNLEADAARLANYYRNDGITVESIMADYAKHLANEAARADRARANAHKIIDVDAPKAIRAFGHIPTPAELAAYQREYNDIHNEGGEGYVPTYCTTADIASAEDLLAHAE